MCGAGVGPTRAADSVRGLGHTSGRTPCAEPGGEGGSDGESMSALAGGVGARTGTSPTDVISFSTDDCGAGGGGRKQSGWARRGVRRKAPAGCWDRRVEIYRRRSNALQRLVGTAATTRHAQGGGRAPCRGGVQNARARAGGMEGQPRRASERASERASQPKHYGTRADLRARRFRSRAARVPAWAWRWTSRGRRSGRRRGR